MPLTDSASRKIQPGEKPYKLAWVVSTAVRLTRAFRYSPCSEI